jgi:hypothetical protein
MTAACARTLAEIAAWPAFGILWSQLNSNPREGMYTLIGSMMTMTDICVFRVRQGPGGHDSISEVSLVIIKFAPVLRSEVGNRFFES